MQKKPEERKSSEIKNRTRNNKPIISLNEYGSVNYSYDGTDLEIEPTEIERLAHYDINVQTVTDKGQKKLHIDAGGYVGAAPLSNFIINVEPKFDDIKSYGRLIHYVNGFYDVKFLDDKIDFLENKNQTLYFHIELLIHYAETILKEGLYKNYITIQEDSPYLKGKLLFLPTETTSGQILNDSRFNLQFSCEHDEFSANMLENQILLYTLDCCQRESPILHQKLKIQRLIHEIDYDVKMPTSITRHEFERLHYTSINKRYKNALVCCEQIISGFGFDSLREHNHQFIKPFFIKMNDLFQDFIACLLNDKKYYKYYVKADQFRVSPGKKEKEYQTQTTAWEISGSIHYDGPKQIRPDIITYKDSDCTEIHAIMDAKYKDDEKGTLDEDDMYQIAFYLNHYKKKIAYAVLPEHKKSLPDYKIKAKKQDLEIRVRHINVEDTLDWIFDKNIDDKTKVSTMLESKFLRETSN